MPHGKEDPAMKKSKTILALLLALLLLFSLLPAAA